MNKEWIKETARDLIALGGLPFFLLVLVRVSIPPAHTNYVLQFVISGVIFFILSIFLKPNLNAGLSFILLILVSIFYGDWKFGILAGIMYVLLIASLFYLKKDWKSILKGILAGAISVALGYSAV